MNPYEPATELDDAILLEQPRKTTKAFRRTMWGLVAVAIGYPSLQILLLAKHDKAMDLLRSPAVNDFAYHTDLGRWLYSLFF